MGKMLLILLLYPACSFAQGIDSTSSYCSPIWRIWKIVHMAQQAASCDSLVHYQENEINKGIKAQASIDSVLSIRTREKTLSSLEAWQYHRLYNTQIGLTKVEKKKKMKWFWIATGGLVLSVANFFH